MVSGATGIAYRDRAGGVDTEFRGQGVQPIAPGLRQFLAQLGATLVDMETAAVAQAAERLGLPWMAIKATTDDANGESAGDFSANLTRAAKRAAEAAEAVLSVDLSI